MIARTHTAIAGACFAAVVAFCAATAGEAVPDLLYFIPLLLFTLGLMALHPVLQHMRIPSYLIFSGLLVATVAVHMAGYPDRARWLGLAATASFVGASVDTVRRRRAESKATREDGTV